MPLTLTRGQLVAAVEAGIAASPRLSRAEKIALRSVAATTERVAVRRFQIGDCGCPLTQIGCNRDALGYDGWTDEQDRIYSAFFTTFDTAVIDAVDGDSRGFLPRMYTVRD